jgi:hypothetical protein
MEYNHQAYGLTVGGAEMACGQAVSREDRTVGENLDFKIARLEEELARLKASRESLGPLLPLKVRDIRNAMDY